MSLIQCPDCKRNILYDSVKCTYCGCKLVPKNINGNHLIQCPNCKRDITPTSPNCSYCGYKLNPIRNDKLEMEEREEKVETKTKITSLIVVLIIVFILFKVCSPFQTIENTKPSSTSTYGNTKPSSTPTYSNKYFVNTDVIFAGTSESNYNTMMNCIVSGDQKAVGTMVLNGQVKYLYKNDIVYLVKAKFKYFIVRPEGSTEIIPQIVNINC
jgi:hypothetical protein